MRGTDNKKTHVKFVMIAMTDLMENKMCVCKNGYELQKDLKPPQRCHSDEQFYIDSCKECSAYDHRYDIIDQAIESAKCRIYRLKANRGESFAHQKKAENQIQLMNITIDALECYKENLYM